MHFLDGSLCPPAGGRSSPGACQPSCAPASPRQLRPLLHHAARVSRQPTEQVRAAWHRRRWPARPSRGDRRTAQSQPAQWIGPWWAGRAAPTQPAPIAPAVRGSTPLQQRGGALMAAAGTSRPRRQRHMWWQRCSPATSLASCVPARCTISSIPGEKPPLGSPPPCPGGRNLAADSNLLYMQRQVRVRPALERTADKPMLAIGPVRRYI